MTDQHEYQTADTGLVLRFMKAARLGEHSVLAQLLPKVDANAKDQDHRTALMLAAGMGHDRCIELLLPHTDAKVTDQEGWTALMRASIAHPKTSSARRARCVELLLPHSDIQAQTAGGTNALMCAAQTGFEEGVALLLPRTPIHVKNHRGMNALDIAIRHRHLAISTLLLEAMFGPENSPKNASSKEKKQGKCNQREQIYS